MDVKEKYKKEHAEKSALGFPSNAIKKRAIDYVKSRLGIINNEQSLDDIVWMQKGRFLREVEEAIDVLGEEMCSCVFLNAQKAGAVLNESKQYLNRIYYHIPVRKN